MSLVAPDDTPASEQIIQKVENVICLLPIIFANPEVSFQVLNGIAFSVQDIILLQN